MNEKYTLFHDFRSLYYLIWGDILIDSFVVLSTDLVSISIFLKKNESTLSVSSYGQKRIRGEPKSLYCTKVQEHI